MKANIDSTMGRITGSYPDDLDLLIEGAVEAGVFGGKSDALREFVREYFDDHENERIAAAIALYERERITLGDAARLADVDRWTMRDLLREHGVELRIGLADDDDAEYEREAARELDFSDEETGDDGESASE
jgi:predicted HTH domain antitoxin